MKMGKQIDKLEFLFQNLVKMSRLETGMILIKKEKEDLVQTLSHAVAQIVPRAAKKQMEISVDTQEKFWILHDRKWTEEANFNLLDNAVKYTDVGGKIHIEIQPQYPRYRKRNCHRAAGADLHPFLTGAGGA